MAILEILEYPNPLLKKKSSKVEKIDDNLRQVLMDMLETMYDDAGVGLAAPQVGILKRMIVIDVEQDREEGIPDNPLFLINPEIVWKSEETEISEEGCLSVPGMRAEVERFYKIVVRYLDEHGEQKELEAEGFFARALQHEIDHLNGILYIDRLSRLKRNMLLKKLEKSRETEE